MKQTQFEWNDLGNAEELSEVVFEAKTIETAIALMATALITVVRGAEQAKESADER